MFEQIKKRDGRIQAFDSSNITAAIAKAGDVTGEFTGREAKKLTLKVLTLAHELRLGPIPEVEEIQDIVERVLLDSPFHRTAKAYILYREARSQMRGQVDHGAGSGASASASSADPAATTSPTEMRSIAHRFGHSRSNAWR